MAVIQAHLLLSARIACWFSRLEYLTLFVAISHRILCVHCKDVTYGLSNITHVESTVAQGCDLD